MKRNLMRLMAIIASLCLVLCMACPAYAAESDRVSFLLMCNEGMRNDGGNAENTMMVVSFEPSTANIRLLVFTWDSFVNLEGYDIPQLLDQPFRTVGPEGTLKTFNENFGQHLELFLSVNYLNLANLIDSFGGVTVDISRAERNALNGMVGSKKKSIESMADMGMVSQMVTEGLADQYYLEEWGDETHLNGLQAVGFGWLQYDSVYNCCLREIDVIADLFNSVGSTIKDKVAFYTNDVEKPQSTDDRRIINLDDMTDDDEAFLMECVQPIFDKTYHNLEEKDILGISIALGRAAYLASRQGINVFKNVECAIFPLEATNDYDIIAGREGHIVDFESNAKAISDFLYGD